MKPVQPEFSRPIEVARVPPSGSVEKIVATTEECAVLARRMDLPAIGALSATLTVMPWRSGGAEVKGSLRAEIEQVCVVTLEPFSSTVREPVERFYLPPGIATGSAQDDEADEIVNGAIDLGELVAETLALAIDPYPRSPGAVFAADAELEGGTETSPFATLRTLKPGAGDGG